MADVRPDRTYRVQRCKGMSGGTFRRESDAQALGEGAGRGAWAAASCSEGAAGGGELVALAQCPLPVVVQLLRVHKCCRNDPI